MSLFAKKCEYCKTKIEKGQEVIGNVKVPEFLGLRDMSFCSGEHVEKYAREVKSIMMPGSCSTCRF